ncbi:hypothetical protein C8J56DRAFT_949714 [Mycena floridula]|nr:hypothetical protein C8J56DRAFT_949714 [Mycena floridula]
MMSWFFEKPQVPSHVQDLQSKGGLVSFVRRWTSFKATGSATSCPMKSTLPPSDSDSSSSSSGSKTITPSSSSGSSGAKSLAASDSWSDQAHLEQAEIQLSRIPEEMELSELQPLAPHSVKVVPPIEALEHFKAQRDGFNSLLRPFQFRVEFGFDVGALTDANLETLPQCIYLDTIDPSFHLDASKWQDLCRLAQPHRLSLSSPMSTVLSTDHRQGSISESPNSGSGAEEEEAESEEEQEEEKQEKKKQDAGEDDTNDEDKDEEGHQKQGKGKETESSKATKGLLYFCGSISLEDEQHKPYATIHHQVDLRHSLGKGHQSNSCHFDFRSITFQYQALNDNNIEHSHQFARITVQPHPVAKHRFYFSKTIPLRTARFEPHITSSISTKTSTETGKTVQLGFSAVAGTQKAEFAVNTSRRKADKSGQDTTSTQQRTENLRKIGTLRGPDFYSWLLEIDDEYEKHGLELCDDQAPKCDISLPARLEDDNKYPATVVLTALWSVDPPGPSSLTRSQAPQRPRFRQFLTIANFEAYMRPDYTKQRFVEVNTEGQVKDFLSGEEEVVIGQNPTTRYFMGTADPLTRP